MAHPDYGDDARPWAYRDLKSWATWLRPTGILRTEAEIQPDGSVKTIRKYQALGPSKGEGAISKKQAEVERDKCLSKLSPATVDGAVQNVIVSGVALFGQVAKMYEEAYLGREKQIAKPTREKKLPT
ncbi:MAG TPA: hypothetical protein VEQ63_03755 [Bryobacteraceae bacterium]|nr:hypothetical protein [Bryobacteraceae bacterium]